VLQVARRLSVMLSRAPAATLCPYTTLFRSAVTFMKPEARPPVVASAREFGKLRPRSSRVEASPTITTELTPIIKGADGAMSTTRSEEHTSELQSRFDLVCRRLLERKT